MNLRETILLEKHILMMHTLREKFKEGITDAVLHGSIKDNYEDDYSFYEEGFKFGTTLYAKLMVKNDFFKERKEKI